MRPSAGHLGCSGSNLRLLVVEGVSEVGQTCLRRKYLGTVLSFTGFADMRCAICGQTHEVVSPIKHCLI